MVVSVSPLWRSQPLNCHVLLWWYLYLLCGDHSLWTARYCYGGICISSVAVTASELPGIAMVVSLSPLWRSQPLNCQVLLWWYLYLLCGGHSLWTARYCYGGICISSVAVTASELPGIAMVVSVSPLWRSQPLNCQVLLWWYLYLLCGGNSLWTARYCYGGIFISCVAVTASELPGIAMVVSVSPLWRSQPLNCQSLVIFYPNCYRLFHTNYGRWSYE